MIKKVKLLSLQSKPPLLPQLRAHSTLIFPTSLLLNCQLLPKAGSSAEVASKEDRGPTLHGTHQELIKLLQIFKFQGKQPHPSCYNSYITEQGKHIREHLMFVPLQRSPKKERQEAVVFIWWPPHGCNAKEAFDRRQGHTCAKRQSQP